MNTLKIIQTHVYNALKEQVCSNVLTSSNNTTPTPFIQIGESSSKHWIVFPKGYIITLTFEVCSTQSSNAELLDLVHKTESIFEAGLKIPDFMFTLQALEEVDIERDSLNRWKAKIKLKLHAVSKHSTV